MGREDEIRLIAYSIWKEESCPNGRDCEHWFRAEVIWEVQNEKAAVLCDLRDTEFADRLPLWKQAKELLAQGPLSLDEMARRLNKRKSIIKARMYQHKNCFVYNKTSGQWRLLTNDIS